MGVLKKIIIVCIIGIITYFLVLNIFTGLRVQGYSYLFRATKPYDLVLKHALIIDGSGENEPFRGDIAITDGYIAAVGYINAKESQIFDAGGLSVIPCPVKIKKNDEVVEHLLRTSFPRYPAENIFLREPPYEGLSLAQAARTAGLSAAEMSKSLITGAGADSKVFLVAVKGKEGDESNEELLALLTGYKAKALGEKNSGFIRAGYKADFYIYKTADFTREELNLLLAKGAVPTPVHRIEGGKFIQ